MCLEKVIDALVRAGAHAFLVRATCYFEATNVPHEADTVTANLVQRGEGALGLDHEWCGLSSVQFAVALGVADPEHLLGVPYEADVTPIELRELHGAVLPVGLHGTERVTRSDVVVLHMASVDVVADLVEPILPCLSLPAVGWVCIYAKALVHAAQVNHVQEVAATHRGCPGVDLVGEHQVEVRCMLAQFPGPVHEPLIALFDQVVAVVWVSELPEPPGIPRGHFQTVGQAPEHRDHLDAQLRAEVHEVETVVFRPVLDLAR